MERGTVNKSYKGRKVSAGKKVRESGKQLDSVQEETPVVSATEVIVDRKHNRPLLLQKGRHGMTKENLRKVQTSEVKGPFGRKGWKT